jgi:hypothetical protein
MSAIANCTGSRAGPKKTFKILNDEYSHFAWINKRGQHTGVVLERQRFYL